MVSAKKKIRPKRYGPCDLKIKAKEKRHIECRLSVAEREGFEPSLQLPVNTSSRYKVLVLTNAIKIDLALPSGDFKQRDLIQLLLIPANFISVAVRLQYFFRVGLKLLFGVGAF